jgi:ribose transport system substrate-binding protein
VRVGQILFSNNPSQLAYGRGVEEYLGQYGIEVTTVNGDINPQTQADQVSDFIAAGVDVILLQPVDPAAAVTPIQEAQAAGVPILTWGIKPDESVTTPFVELNEYDATFEAGVIAAQTAQELWPDDPLGMVLVDIPTLPLCHDLRVGGFRDGVLSVDPDAEIVAEVDGKGDQLSSTTVMEDVISSGRPFNLVIGCNGPMTLGALGALEAAGRGQAVDKVPVSEFVVSIDGSLPEVTELLDPESALALTVLLTPVDNAAKVGDMTIKLLRGEIGPTDPYLDTTGSSVLGPDCEAVNTALREQYYQEEEVPCP